MLGVAQLRPAVAYRAMASSPKSIEQSERKAEADRKALGQAIKRLRKRADLTQDQAAARMDLAQTNSWRRYEWGERGLDTEKLERIAEALGTTRETILSEQATILGRPIANVPSPAPLGPRHGTVTASDAHLVLLPIRERVQAGAWLLADDFVQDYPRTYPAAKDPRFPQADQWLSEVIGDSVNQLAIHDGDLVHCVDAIAIGYFPKTGDVVEVERLRFQGAERELTLKQVEVSTEGDVFLWPRSTNPRWHEPIRMRSGLGETEEIEVRIRGLVIAAIRRF